MSTTKTMEDLDRLKLNKRAIKTFLSLTSYKRAQKTENLGVDRSVWSRWERGERSPSLKKIKEIAPLFDLTVAEMAFAIDWLQENQSTAA